MHSSNTVQPADPEPNVFENKSSTGSLIDSYFWVAVLWQMYLGSFIVFNGEDVTVEGPWFGTGDAPPTKSCSEVCEDLFYSAQAGYMNYVGSISPTEITRTCNADQYVCNTK